MQIKDILTNAKIMKRIGLFLIFVAVVFAFSNQKLNTAIKTSFHNTMKNNGFSLHDVILYGRINADRENILAQTKFVYGQSIFNVDLEKIKQQVEKIGWVKTAVVERQFPDRINIKIVERKPVAIWQYNKRLNLIDADGVVISNKNIEKFAYLKTVVGKNANKKAVDFLKLIYTDKAMSQIVVAGVYVSNRRWDLIILDKITVKLPAHTAEDAWKVLGRYAREKNLLARPIRTIDMRVPKKIFIKMRKKSKNKI